MALDVANLSTLYRVAALARACELEIAAFGQVASWLEVDLGQPLEADAVSLILLFSAWLQQTALDIEQIAFFVAADGSPDSAGGVALAYADMQVIWAQATGVLFGPAVLLGDSVDAERAAEIYTALLALSPSPLLEVGEDYRQHVANAPPPPLALVPVPVTAAALQGLREPPLGLSEAELQQVLAALNAANAAQAEVLDNGLAGPLDSAPRTSRRSAR
ncbi:hypothetical protein P4209_20220 [Pseudomonas aeruginosa]|nr:hypothetical protein [Pseudomonas aeruginosa]